jgi:hypothetical protein
MGRAIVRQRDSGTSGGTPTDSPHHGDVIHLMNHKRRIYMLA